MDNGKLLLIRKAENFENGESWESKAIYEKILTTMNEFLVDTDTIHTAAKAGNPIAPAVDRPRKRFIILVSAVAALGGLLFGLIPPSSPAPFPISPLILRSTEYMLGWAVSSILIGCAVGATVAGKGADRYGRQLHAHLLRHPLLPFRASGPVCPINCGYSSCFASSVASA